MLRYESVKNVMAEEVTLRPARATDAASLAYLWVVTFPDKFGPILGQDAERIICDWLRLSQRHLQTTTVAEVDRTVVGYIILETSSAPCQDSGRWLWRALQLHNGIFGALRSFIKMVLVDNDRPLQDGEVYIEMVGVSPDWRGRGLASRLIAFAEGIAHSERANLLTLNVVSGNAAAIGLYKKMGFVTTAEKQSRTLKLITGHDGYLEMSKQL